MIRTWKLRLYPTPAQAQALASQLDWACDLYNAALQERRDTYLAAEQAIGRRRPWHPLDGDKRPRPVRHWDTEARKYVEIPAPKGLSGYEQSKRVTDLRRTNPGGYPEGMAALVQHEVLKRLDRSFDAFFRRVKAGENPGYPRFRQKRRYDSLTFALTAPSRNGGITSGAGYLRGDTLHLTGVGAFPVLRRPRRRGASQGKRVHGVRVHRELPDGAIARSAIVTRSCGRWYVCVALELPDPPPQSGDRPDVGMDLGVITWATLYSEDSGTLAAADADLARQTPAIRHLRDGQAIKIDGVHAGKRYAGRVRRWQRAVARRTRRGHAHSHRRAKAVAMYAKAKEVERNARSDHRHKVAKIIADRWGMVGMEDLGVRDMTRAPRHEPELDRPARLKEELNREILDQAWYLLRSTVTYKAEGAGGKVRVTLRFEPTTVPCSDCGRPVPKPPSMRWHTCPHCGYAVARTVNSARNVLLLARSGAQRERPGGAHPSGDNGFGRGLRTTAPPPPLAGGPTSGVRKKRRG